MAARAKATRVGISVKKIRPICDLVRGKDVRQAVDILRFTVSPSSQVILKTLNSAVANAENNELLSRERLKIIRITADEGPRLRRFRPKARGRVGRFDRPSCHLTIEVDEQESTGTTVRPGG